MGVAAASSINKKGHIMHQVILVVSNLSGPVPLDEVPAHIVDVMEPYNENLEVERHENYITKGGKVSERDTWTRMLAGEAGLEIAADGSVDVEQLKNLLCEHADDPDSHEIENGDVFEWSTSNPDGKWDWYEIGGRWSGLLVIRAGSRVFQLDEPSWDEDTHDDNEYGDFAAVRANTANLGDIDFETPGEVFAKKAADAYDAYSKDMGPIWDEHGPFMGWQEFIKKNSVYPSTDAHRRLRELWGEHVAPAKAVLDKHNDPHIFGADAITRFGEPNSPTQRERVLEEARCGVLPDVILLEDGGWQDVSEQAVERGLTELEVRRENLNNLLSLDPDTRVTVVDIHY